MAEKWPARRHAEQQAHCRTAGKQNQHTTKRGRENLLQLGTERDADAELAQPLADGIGGEAEGAGDREQ
jgi:hypothetical protein